MFNRRVMEQNVNGSSSLPKYTRRRIIQVEIVIKSPVSSLYLHIFCKLIVKYVTIQFRIFFFKKDK